MDALLINQEKQALMNQLKSHAVEENECSMIQDNKVSK